MNEFKMFTLIIGLHTLGMALCALMLQGLFIGCVYFYTGMLNIDLDNIFVFIRAGAGGGFIAGFGVWLMYRFKLHPRK